MLNENNHLKSGSNLAFQLTVISELLCQALQICHDDNSSTSFQNLSEKFHVELQP
jgi:hypothetical protein